MTEQDNPHNQHPPQEFTQRFIDAVGSVQDYNNRNTGLGYAVSGMFSFLMPDDETTQPRVSPKDKADMEKELVSLLQTDELAQMGVSLVDSNAPYGERIDFEDDDTRQKLPSTLVMLITDGETFRDSLLELNPTPEQKDKVAGGVNSILANTAGMVEAAIQVRGTVDPDHEASQGHLNGFIDDQLNMFMDLSPALVRRGFGEGGAFNVLADYSARHSAGTLDDYVGAKSKGLTSPMPSQWVMDGTPEFVSSRWTEVFEYLKQLRDREESSTYFTELFNKLRADFDTSNKWLEGDTEDKNRQGYLDTYIEPLKAEMAELSKVWEKDFPLENGFYLSEQQA
ncbi:MAG: hypothetical protein AAB436_00440 [Patescibacteria group bacterium]